MEVDIWIPQHELCFEFQDSYHYTTTWYTNNPVDYVQLRDDIKQVSVRQQGWDLVVIPCWWDGNLESLIGTINFCKPDAVPGSAPLISLNPPLEFFSDNLIPGVGELMLASFPLHPKFNMGISPENAWWMGEKYDGIRCCWNPQTRKLYTRYGKTVHLPLEFAANFPRVFLDGELWFGRGEFTSTLMVIQEYPSTVVEWCFLRVPVFDIPIATEYEERYSFLVHQIDIDAPFIQMVYRVLCKAPKHLNSWVQSILDGGGEGVILRKPASFYERGRNSSLVKLKAASSDMEAMVIGIGDDNSVQLLLPSGKSFLVPAQNVHIHVPRIGAVVTFTYSTFARRDVPADPDIVRLRADVSWEETKRSYQTEQKFLNESSRVTGLGLLPIGHLSEKNMRAFLEAFAKGRNMDPLHPETWYMTSREAIVQVPGGRAVFHKLRGGYFKALTKLFPEVNFDESKFPSMPRMYWDNIKNRRKFFEQYAKDSGFDPLSPEHWYSQPRNKIAAMKGAKMMLEYHRFSVLRALLDLFPNIGLDKSKFSSSYAVPEVRRNFFEKYAKLYRFDPLVAENWYRQPAYRILAVKGAKRVISFHNNSVSKALATLFPKIGFDPSKFNAKQYWSDAKNRRKFFESYARDYGFDSRDPEAWYKQTKKTILGRQDIQKILRHHNGITGALLDLFPDIGLVKSRLFPPQALWSNINARRDFFLTYAAQNGFDPLVPSNWYEQPRERIMAVKGADRVMFYHGGEVTQALLDLFPTIGLEKSRFTFPKLWKDAENRRRFFEEYAEANGFDPQDSHNWYSQPHTKIMAARGAYKVLLYHRNSISKALLDLFPNIGLEKSKLP
eukprot:Phypoly_transcript_01476.p1 GENE.Phypoly_transcript_01476~~Phypoly_transcript_01476.p1  ORF type:complete len:889 (+),score=81.31 Phypoly_transcript_01476:156-2669(+)